MQTSPRPFADPATDPALVRALDRLCPGHDGQWRPLSGGRTNRVWRVGGMVVKCHDPAAATPLFPNDPQAEELALRHFGPLGIAPVLRAAGQGWLILDHLPAGRWGGPPAPVAHLLHRLHTAAPPAAPLRALPNGSAAILAHAASFAPPGLPAPPDDPHLPPVPARPVHGDAVAGNILTGPDGPLLIDWQCPGLGDPCEDLATLISPAMMWLYTGAIAPAGWADALLDAYPDAAIATRTRALLPLYRWRIMAHCAWKAARGDADYARALQIERDTP